MSLPRTSGQPRIRPVGAWQDIRGFAYGVRQPGLFGEIVIDVASGDALRKLTAGIVEASGLAAPKPDAPPGIECARAMAAWAGLLQARSRIPVVDAPWVRALPAKAGQATIYEIVAPYYRPEPTLLALRWVFEACNRMLDKPGAWPQQLHHDRLDAALKPMRPGGVNAYSVPLAAHRLGLPLRLTPTGLMVIGTGVHSRWMKSLETDRTSVMGVNLAKRKSYTASALRAAGLPGARHESARDADHAVDIAGRLGYPIVVKPDNLDQGLGVAAGLRNPAEVREAFDAARKLAPIVLVEAHAAGWTHRFTVSHGQVIRVVKRQPGGVTGDGQRTVAQLVDAQADTDLGRARIRLSGTAGVTLDAEALHLLGQAGFSPQSVPDAGRFICMRRRDNFNAGGTNIDLTLDSVHPDNLKLAVDAAMTLRLDLAGIDLIVEDAGVSWLNGGGLICEVNALPQLYAADDDRIYDRILQDVMGSGAARIPVQVDIHPRAPDDSQVQAALRELESRNANALSCRQGLFVDGRKVTSNFHNGFGAAQAVLARPDVRGAVCLLSMEDVLRFGLPVDRCDRIERIAPGDGVRVDEAKMKRLERMVAPHITMHEAACRT